MLNMCKMIRQLLLNLEGFKEQTSSCSMHTDDISSVTMTQERNGAASEDEDTMQNWSVLLEAIGHAAKACVSLTNEVSYWLIFNKKYQYE